MPEFHLWTRLLCLWTLLLPLFSLPARADDDAPLSIVQRHLVAAPAPLPAPSFLPPDQAFHVTSAHDNSGPYIDLQAAPGYYLYREHIHIMRSGRDVTASAHFSASEPKNDPTYGIVQVYHRHARIDLNDWPSNEKIEVRYQGCAEAGLCYPPQHKMLTVPNDVIRPAISQAAPAPTTIPSMPSPALSPWTLLMLYAAGIGLTFTPCVLPMLPIACAVIVGRTPSRRQALGLSLAYVAGMVVAYAVLGACVGLFGSSLQLQAQLQRPWVLIPMAIACTVAAGWLFDLYSLQLPLWLSMRMQKANDRLHNRGVLGTLVTGALSTLVLSPCLSAPLAGVLVYLSTTGDITMAMLALTALALGIGTPIVLCCTFGANLLPRAGAWMSTVKGLFGLLLIGTALWLLSRLLPPTATLLLVGLWGLGIARLLGVGAPLQAGARSALQIIGWTIALWSAACVIGAAGGGTDVLRPLAAYTAGSRSASSSSISTAPISTAPRWPQLTTVDALQHALDTPSARPLLIDIYADWCISCQHMEHDVYAAPELQPILGLFQGFRLDVTHPDEKMLEFLQQHGLFGPPGVLFFIKGQEAAPYRIIGERSREEMEKHLHAVLNAPYAQRIMLSHD